MAFDATFQARALHFIAGLTQEEKAQLRHCIDALRLDPWVDNVTKFVYPVPPLVFCLYQDGPFRIVYRVKNNEVVDILNISPAPYAPLVHEWDNWRKN